MEIQSADIRYFSLGSLDGGCEGVRHIKVLPWLSVVQATEGNYGIALGGGNSFDAGEGGFFIAPAGVQQDIVHHNGKSTGRMRARWLFIDAAVNGTLELGSLFDLPVILPADYRDGMNEAFDGLFFAGNVFEKYACCYRVLGILADCGREKLKKPNAAMLSAFDYIRENYTRDIRPADIAKRLNMSESNFFAVFRRHFGTSPIAYINNYRISAAAEMLEKTDKTVSEIALSVGIGDPVYFNRLFRRNYQLPPGRYRESKRKC